MKIYAFLLFYLFLAGGLRAQEIQQQFKKTVDSVFALHPDARGFMVRVEVPDQQISWSYAVGRSGEKPLSVTQPVLVASNTKPYVAATILKLAEKGKLKIDQPIRKLISRQSEHLLSKAGYQTDQITLYHLMSHTSGIRDYVDESYFQFISAHKDHHWTRDEQIARAADAVKPLALAGDTFRYADVNFVLLTEVIETVTHQPFYKAMRSLLNFGKHHLDETWFISLEKTPKNTSPLADQHWAKYGWDICDLDPSWDLYGGGGIAATVQDLAHFFQLLFGDQKIIGEAMLEKMHTDVPPNLTVNYCLGIKKVKIAGLTGYNHGGGLGTDVVYIPGLNATIAISVLEASKRPVAVDISRILIESLHAKSAR